MSRAGNIARDASIYAEYEVDGQRTKKRAKVIAGEYNLSESRVKAIIFQQRKARAYYVAQAQKHLAPE